MSEEGTGVFTASSGLKRIKTGVPGLNNLMEGGFPHPSVVLVAGDSGAGKTVFGVQYLYNGAQKYDEPGIYLRIQGYDTDVEWYSLKSGLDIGELQENRKLITTTYELSKFEQFETRSVTRKITKKLSQIIESVGAKRVVIDSVTPFGYLSSRKSEYRTLLHGISKELKRLDCTALFISEKSGKDSLTPFDVEQYISDGVIELKEEERAGRKSRVLYINKMMATRTPLDGITFNISDEGFKLLSSYYE